MHPDLSPTLRILLALGDGPLTTRELVERSGIGITAIYKYLSILRATGLVRMSRRGVYELTGAGRESLERRRKELCKILRCGGEKQ